MSIINPFPSAKPPPPVEFTAFLATNMDALLLHILPTGFFRSLTDDAIVVDFGGGAASRLIGEFDYSSPIDLPIGGDLTRLQEMAGGAVKFEAKYLDMPIVDMLASAGHDTAVVLEQLFSGDDKFTGSNFNDLLRAFDGDDRMQGRGGNDTLYGGGGSDTVDGGDGYDILFGGEGDDTVDGGDGGGYLRGEGGDDVVVGGNAFDDLHGNAGSDTLYGGGGDDWVVGGQGDDRLLGEGGNDLMLGNLGWDSMSGGAGADTIRGGQENDVLEGGDGDDWLSGDRGFDVLYGGRGADTFHFFPGAEVDRIHDFNAGEGDRVHLQLGTLYTVEQFGADVLIRSGQFDQMVLVGVQLSSLPQGWLFEA
jgi:Ca2+-binding RTX toxin-like protein